MRVLQAALPFMTFSEVHMAYCICRAERHHIPALNAIELAAATIFPTGSIPEHILIDRVPSNVLLAAQKENMLWVAVDTHDAPVGYVLLQIVEGLLLLAQLDVHPLHGRKGLGTALVQRAIAQVQEGEFAHLYLTTFSHVPWNAPWYTKIGFAVMGEHELPTAIANILREERLRGLDNRVAMQLCTEGT